MDSRCIIVIGGLSIIGVVLTSCGSPGRIEESDAAEGQDALDSPDSREDGTIDSDIDEGFECVDDAIHGWPDLSRLAGFRTIIGGLRLDAEAHYGSVEYTSTEVLRCVVRIVGWFVINDDRIPDNLLGLRSLQDVSGGLVIGDPEFRSEPNLGLTSLEGLSSLERVGWVAIDGARDLADISGLRSLRYVGGDIRIRGNPALFVCDGAFESLDVVGGSVIIESNENLPRVAVLRGIRIISGDFVLSRLPAIRTLEGLENLQYVGGTVEVFDTGLTSLSGLNEDIVVFGGEERSIRVVENPELPTCEIEEFVERLRERGWTGTAEIRGNADDVPCE